MARLLMPFLSPLLWTGIITLALHPVYKRIEGLMKGRKGLMAGITTLVALLTAFVQIFREEYTGQYHLQN